MLIFVITYELGMYVKLIQIGNSMGLRLPKSLIKQYHLDRGDIELRVEKEGILIIPAKQMISPRKDWDRLFTEAITAGFNVDNDAAEFNSWDVALSDGLDD